MSTPSEQLLLQLADELQWRAIHSSGPGGQNVNKVATAMQMRFDVGRCKHLTGGVRQRFTALAGNRMTREQVLVMTARRHRTQSANRRDLMERLERMLHRALQAPKVRRKRKPSKASRQQRLNEKKRRGDVKQARRKPAY